MKHFLLSLLLLTSVALGQERALLPVVPNLQNIQGNLTQRGELILKPLPNALWYDDTIRITISGVWDLYRLQLRNHDAGGATTWALWSLDNGGAFPYWRTSPWMRAWNFYSRVTFGEKAGSSTRYDPNTYRINRYTFSDGNVEIWDSSLTIRNGNISAPNGTMTSKAVVTDSLRLKMAVYDTSWVLIDSILWTRTAIRPPVTHPTVVWNSELGAYSREGYVDFEMYVGHTYTNNSIHYFRLVSDSANGVKVFTVQYDLNTTRMGRGISMDGAMGLVQNWAAEYGHKTTSYGSAPYVQMYPASEFQVLPDNNYQFPLKLSYAYYQNRTYVKLRVFYRCTASSNSTWWVRPVSNYP